MYQECIADTWAEDLDKKERPKDTPFFRLILRNTLTFNSDDWEPNKHQHSSYYKVL